MQNTPFTSQYVYKKWTGWLTKNEVKFYFKLNNLSVKKIMCITVKWSNRWLSSHPIWSQTSFFQFYKSDVCIECKIIAVTILNLQVNIEKHIFKKKNKHFLKFAYWYLKKNLQLIMAKKELCEILLQLNQLSSSNLEVLGEYIQLNNKYISK